MSNDLWPHIQRKVGVDDDGIPGGETARAVAKALGVHLPAPKPGAWPSDRGGQEDMFRFYGQPGMHQTMCHLPKDYPMVLAWQMGVPITKFACHEKAHDSFKEVFEEALEYYGREKIIKLGLNRFGGCLNVRKKRNGTTWSTHAWGAAIDLYPDKNKLKWGADKALFAQPEYEPFWEIVESKHLVSLGREKDFDWMHFQAAEL